jgi:ubiquinone/menaquinone biosynthesis C-methylase UbiE
VKPEPHLQRRPHAVLDVDSRRLKALKIERLLDLEHRPGPIRLLEIGTGSGGIAHYFGTHPTQLYQVDAVDVHDNRLVIDGYRFQQVADTHLPFADSLFDVVITNHVIEHVGDDSAQRHHLAEVRRVMCIEGVGYLAVPNRWMLVEPHFRLAFLSWLPRSLSDLYVRVMHKGTHYDCKPLRLGQLEHMLDAAGFRYRNLCVPALRATLSIEGAQSRLQKWIARVPDAVWNRMLPLIPTLIYCFWSDEATGFPEVRHVQGRGFRVDHDQ